MSIPKLIDILGFGQIKGRDGQIHVLSTESYKAWLTARTVLPQRPKIQLDLEKAQRINDELATSPNQSDHARKLGMDRTSLIRRPNLIRLAPAIKD